MAKPEIEFTPASGTPFTPCEGHVAGLTERILAVDGTHRTATRVLRFAPGTDTTANGVQTHDFWEEVFILEGSIRDLRLERTFRAGDYACRPPGMEHGPWVSEDGCLTFEVRYHAGG